ncbi:MAG: D-alanyl-D-alanine carboxypeptidase/D-alanyl-D-alanine-endopeptidase [Halothiobacillaceae bacterium]
MKPHLPALLRALALSLLLPFTQAGCAAHLPAEVEETLARHKADPGALSIWVQAVDSNEPVLAWNADLPQNPASVMKLVTTAVALDVLGPNYTWPTETYVTRPVNQGVLQGDLVLKGYGNPLFLTEDLWRLLQRLRERGLHTIHGDLVLDNTFFSLPPEDPAAFDGEPYKPYNAQPDALLLNQRATRFVVQPDPITRKLHIASELPVPGLRIENRVKLAKGKGCNGSHDDLFVEVRPSPQGPVVEFSGKYSPACGERDFYRVVAEPKDMLLGAFRAMWQALGGSFDGGVRVEPVPKRALLFDVFLSRPLAEVIIPMNKQSSNVMARQLLLSVGAAQFGPPATLEKGQRAVDLWLERQGWSWPEFVLGNGSGLSRETRISARHLGDLLMKVYHGPTMLEFTSSLPIVGVDGTMRKRLRNEDIKGRAQFKTGTLNGVRAIAGYMLSRSGRAYAVVILHNEPGVQNGIGSRVQDAILKWVYEQP